MVQQKNTSTIIAFDFGNSKNYWKIDKNLFSQTRDFNLLPEADGQQTEGCSIDNSASDQESIKRFSRAPITLANKISYGQVTHYLNWFCIFWWKDIFCKTRIRSHNICLKVTSRNIQTSRGIMALLLYTARRYSRRKGILEVELQEKCQDASSLFKILTDR